MSIDIEYQCSNNYNILRKYSPRDTSYSVMDQITVERAVKELRKKYPDRDLSLAEIKQVIEEEYEKILNAKFHKENDTGFEIDD